MLGGRRDRVGPNLLLLGVPKAGTTSIADVLTRHPEICFGRAKEAGILSNSQYSKEDAVRLYRNHYANSGPSVRYLADGTPWLFYMPEMVERAYAVGAPSGLKMILSLRAPADRMESMYRDQVVRGTERRPFAEAIRADLDLLEHAPTTAIVAHSYLRASLYSTHLERLRADLRPEDSLRVVYFEDLIDEERGPAIIESLGVWLETSLGPLTHSNPNLGQRPLAQPLVDRMVAYASRLPPGWKARLRPAATAFGRRIVAASPRRQIPSPSTEIPDSALALEISALLAADVHDVVSIMSNVTTIPTSAKPVWLGSS